MQITGAASFDQAVLKHLFETAEAAGREILRFYNCDPGVTYKADQSPLTLADRASHNHIVSQLKSAFPQIPIISEEGQLPDASVRSGFERFWLVDPLDGTKEFIKRNDQFTVNIALIQAGKPIFGVVHVPTTGVTYHGVEGKGAWLRMPDHEPHALQIKPFEDGQQIRVAVSRSHPNADLSRFLEMLPNAQTQEVGSSLKFCKVADMGIDLYPRFGPLHEWDTAAAHIVAQEAGAVVTDLDGQQLRYNKPVMTHDHVLVCRSQTLHAQVRTLIQSMSLA